MELQRIASFSVDHNRLQKGMYTSRVDGDVVTYDIRMKRPNQGDYLSCGALHTFDLKLSVIIPFWFSTLIHDHRAYRRKPVRIGDIICLHPGNSLQTKQTLQLLHRTDRSSFFPLQPFFVLTQYKLCIFLRKLYKLLLLAFLRNPDIDTMPPLFRKPLF